MSPTERENDKAFLNWIYERMICVHGEKDLYDYMINFKAIIDKIGSEHDKTRSQAIDEAIIEIGKIYDDGMLYYNSAIKALKSLKTIS